MNFLKKPVVFLETRTDENEQFLKKLWSSWCLHQFSSLRFVVKKFLPGLVLSHKLVFQSEDIRHPFIRSVRIRHPFYPIRSSSVIRKMCRITDICRIIRQISDDG